MTRYKRLSNLLLSLVLVLFFIPQAFAQELKTLHSGILNLNMQQLGENEFIPLEGEWEFYWKQLISPEQFKDLTLSPEYVHFPSLWNHIKIQNQNLTGQGYSTYRLKIHSQSHLHDVALQIPDVYSAYALWLNGQLISRNGQVGSRRQDYFAQWLPLTRMIELNAGENQLVLQIANFDHERGGAIAPIILGNAHTLFQLRERQLGIDLFLSGALLVGGVFFWGLYLFGQREKSVLYFALFSMVMSHRIMGCGFYALYQLVGTGYFPLTARLEYLTLFLSTWLFNRFVNSLYPEESIKLIKYLIEFVCLSLVLSVFLLPMSWFTQTTTPFNLFSLGVGLPYFSIVLMRAAIHKRLGARFGVLSLFSVLSVAVYMILQYMRFIPDLWWFVPLAILVFVGFQSLVISYRFAHSLNQSRLNAIAGSQAKSQFLATMSHEIRTPMNGVLGMAQLLNGTDLNAEQKKYLDAIQKSGQNLLTILNSILDFSRLESGKIDLKPEAVYLPDLLDEILVLFQPSIKEKNLEFVYNYRPNTPTEVYLDAVRLRQILTNLIHNAIKFTEKGKILLKVRFQEEHICFELRDTGFGLTTEQINHLFDKFYQADHALARKYGGTGLGLAIVKELVELMGGKIFVESELNQGTCFTVHLPYVPVKETIVSSQVSTLGESPQYISEKTLTNVLVVEDNPINQALILAMLDNLGVNASLAEDGQVALGMLERDNYDCVFTDLQMPQLDGYELTRWIRQNYGETLPIIAVTANAFVADKEKCFQAGMNGFLSKPFQLAELKQILMQYTPYQNTP